LVLDNKSNKKSRFPKAKHTGAYCYHYGWVRTQEQMNLKSRKVQKYWNKQHKKIDYSQMDSQVIKEFHGNHPKVIKDWIPKELGLFEVDPNYTPTRKQVKHRFMIKIEKIFDLDLSKKHFKLV
jgi:hypothetical protein